VLASRGVKARKREKHVEITDAELIERLREKAPEMLEAEIDFDKVIEQVSQAGIPQERERLALMVSARSRKSRANSPKSRIRKS
jgi:site-specific DNA-cytosine methylase